MNCCAICKSPATQSCAACNSIYYCSKTHQKEDWKKHKTNCAPFKVDKNDTLGRFIVALRNIKPGEIVIKKHPLLLGPKMASHILCLGCHKKLEQSYKCSKCKWPLCGKKCESSYWHKEECKILSDAKFQPQIEEGVNNRDPVYSCIVPLRALLLKKNDVKKYEIFKSYQSHLENHKGTAIYQILKTTLVPLFLEKLKLDTNEAEILEICSILDTNTFQIRDSKRLVNARGLYPTISLISHDCKPNTKHYFLDENTFQMAVVATVPIKKGELITATYTQTLWGTLARRQHLQMVKFFQCNCLRCQDPTEFGTYTGSIYCTSCYEHQDPAIAPKLIPRDPLDAKSEWYCMQCNHTVPGQQMITGNEVLRKEIEQMDKSSPKNLERFLEKYKTVLHPYNWHCLQIKYALTQIYGTMNGFKLEDLTPFLLERKLELCKELLEVADILEPGWSRFRGVLLYDIQAAMVVKAEKDFSEGKINKEQVEKIFAESINYLSEAGKILSPEPEFKEILTEKIQDLSRIISGH